MLKNKVWILFALPMFFLPVVQPDIVLGSENTKGNANSVQNLAGEEPSIFLQENAGQETQKFQGNPLKWTVLLLGLLIIASLPIIFSLPKDPIEGIKIIVEED